MGNYTLLADDNCAYSRDESLRENFRAHVVFNIITNGSVTFSDNQVMSSPNLRFLTRCDGVIRELVKQRHITLAVRETPTDGIMPLADVFEAFRLEGKLPSGWTDISDSPEIAFMESSCAKIGWAFDEVRANFTNNCKVILLEQARRRHLSIDHVTTLEELIVAEEKRDKGLGRAFLQQRLPGMLADYGIMPKPAAETMLRSCTDAVYLSNLPKTIGLDPIYAEEHRSSFELLRGGQYDLTPIGEEIDLRPRLRAEHFTHGLNQLDIDDVHKIQQSDAFRTFVALTQTPDPIAAFDNLFVTYVELNRVIEDHIIERFRGLMRHSPAPDPRRLRRQYGTWFENGAAVMMDVLSIAASSLWIPGLASNYVVDAVRNRIDPPRPHADGARHELERLRLRQYLEKTGQDQQLRFGEEFHESDSFKREIMVE